MDEAILKGKVARILSEVMGFPEDQIDEGSSPDTVESWDSLKHMHLILALEEQFEVHFTDEKIVEMLSVASIITALNEHISS